MFTKPTSFIGSPYGTKTATGDEPMHDLHATILHLMGFDHERLTLRYGGRDFRLTDVHGQKKQRDQSQVFTQIHFVM
jgi:hypothetical protein